MSSVYSVIIIASYVAARSASRAKVRCSPTFWRAEPSKAHTTRDPRAWSAARAPASGPIWGRRPPSALTGLKVTPWGTLAQLQTTAFFTCPPCPSTWRWRCERHGDWLFGERSISKSGARKEWMKKRMSTGNEREEERR